MNSLVSVIITVYNLEKVVKKCVQSVIMQTYENLEIIIVNDGSTDNSLTVLKSLATKDKRIRVIDQTNMGVEKAKAYGYKAANGKWIAFVDGDDWLPRDAIKNLVNAAEDKNADVVMGRRVKVLDSKGWLKKSAVYKLAAKIDLYNHREFSHEEFMEDLYISFFGVNILSVGMHARVYKKILIDNAEIKYVGLRRHEDLCFNMQVLPYAKKIATIPKVVYYHRYGGVTSRFSMGLMEDAVKQYCLKKEMIEKYHFEEATKYIAIELKNFLVTFIKQHIIFTNMTEQEILPIVIKEMKRPEMREAIFIPTCDKFTSDELVISIKNYDAEKFYHILKQIALKGKTKVRIMTLLARVFR